MQDYNNDDTNHSFVEVPPALVTAPDPNRQPFPHSSADSEEVLFVDPKALYLTSYDTDRQSTFTSNTAQHDPVPQTALANSTRNISRLPWQSPCLDEVRPHSSLQVFQPFDMLASDHISQATIRAFGYQPSDYPQQAANTYGFEHNHYVPWPSDNDREGTPTWSSERAATNCAESITLSNPARFLSQHNSSSATMIKGEWQFYPTMKTSELALSANDEPKGSSRLEDLYYVPFLSATEHPGPTKKMKRIAFKLSSDAPPDAYTRAARMMKNISENSHPVILSCTNNRAAQKGWYRSASKAVDNCCKAYGFTAIVTDDTDFHQETERQKKSWLTSYSAERLEELGLLTCNNHMSAAEISKHMVDLYGKDGAISRSSRVSRTDLQLY